MSQNLQTITLGGGCFWCLEAVFVQVRGVTDVESGYANGHVQNPTYEQVCTGRTGHVEVVRLTFDPSVIGLADLLQIFFAIHDPTTPNRQGNDVGPQYRSGIYYTDPAHAEIARTVMREVQANWRAPLVTELEPLGLYSAAEPEHQEYFENHPHQGYCAFVVAPKVQKFQQLFAHWRRPDA